jgi:regulator of ribonuclease activity A
MTEPTADLYDAHGESLQVVSLQFRSFGRKARFEGVVRTVRCFEDNTLVRATLTEPGEGKVLVVDGGGSLRCALVGDMLGALAVDNGWAGIVLNAGIRDSAALAALELGVKALGTNPRKGAKGNGGEVDVVVEFGGAVIRPGDRLVADEDGVVVLPG